MKNSTPILDVFWALLRAGLWERGTQLVPLAPIDFSMLYDLAEEQSVVGLIAAGLEHVEDRKVTKQEALPFLKKVFVLEGRNESMNAYIGCLINRLRDVGIYAILIKGQGVAQCYSRPQWRSSGDIDFFLDNINYIKAKKFLTPLAESVEKEDASRLHLGMKLDSWTVELHGTMRTKISRRVDRIIATVQKDIFEKGGVRAWRDNDVDVFLPSVDNDVIIVFTHFVKHFYVGGIGLRQICDWCRLLWTYRNSLDWKLLEVRLKKMGLMTEWRAFATLAVEKLSMPYEAMPFYSNNERYRRKAEGICNLVLETGNLGQNKDSSYRSRYSKLISGFITFGRRIGEFLKISTIFPGNAGRFFVTYVFNRTKAMF